MQQVKFEWGDGTKDFIYVEYTGGPGASTMTVQSDPNNTGVTRSKNLSLQVNRVEVATLEVTQDVDGKGNGDIGAIKP